MLKSLSGKLALVLLILFSSIGILYIVLTLFTTRMYQQEVNQKLNHNLAKNLVADHLLTSQGRVHPYAMKELFHLLMVVNPSIEVYLLDTQGTILAFSAPPEKVKRSSIALEPVKRFLAHDDVFPVLGDDPRDEARKKVFSASPIPLHGEPTGYLYIVLGGEEYDSAVEMLQGSYILRLSFWAVLAGLLFAFLAGLLLFHLITRRLRQLASTMDACAKDDFSRPRHDNLQLSHTDRNGDELDRLKFTFSQMIERIRSQVTKLTESDALRRELVANVSHDLRTPLASLHGYLETLLMKEGTLTVDEQRRFLDIAVKQSERVRHLVNELFELAKLDSRETQLNREPFSLGELVQDVTQKFLLAAERKQVTIVANCGVDLPFVMADIALIERALENVIQNALRYTSAGGIITVTLAHTGDGVSVQIADNGCGIPTEDLPHIFDRFYRVEKHSRSESSGLGLAITKKILDLHGSRIEADSKVDIGTTIWFHLPVYAA
jgi:signal transduction histidine kinase